MNDIDEPAGKEFFYKKALSPSLHNEKGMVLIVSLALMLVTTIMGILAISTSTTDVMIAGNQRMREINVATSDGGREVSKPVIEDCASDKKLNNAELATLVEDPPNLEHEIYMGNDPQIVSDNPFSTVDAIKNPDIQLALDDVTVYIDIDYLATKVNGPAEGQSEVPITIVKYYKVNNISRGKVGSEAVVGALYRHVLVK